VLAPISIRKSGALWLRDNGRETKERCVFSKYYTADESFTRSPVWWFNFPERYATTDGAFLNLVCQLAPGSSEFRHLRVPMQFFLDHKHEICFREDILAFSPHLSAEEASLFREIRGTGRIEFGRFEVKSPDQ
jgi:hypothetical protein